MDDMEREWAYNGLDTLVTLDVLEALLPQLDNHTAATYNFARALQGPVLEMGFRGVLTDKARREKIIDEFTDLIDQVERQFQRIVLEGHLGMPGFNWKATRRPKDLILSLPKATSCCHESWQAYDRTQCA